MMFACEACGEAVYPDSGCLAVRVPRGKVLRFCGGCAGERLTMEEHLDRLGMRYYSGSAADAEGWASLGR